MSLKRSCSLCLKTQVLFVPSEYYALADLVIYLENLFTPWFKLIARDFLFGWWDDLYKRKTPEGKLVASSLADVANGSKVIKMT